MWRKQGTTSWILAAASLMALFVPGCSTDTDPTSDLSEYEVAREIERLMTPAEMEDTAFVAGERGWTLDQTIVKIGWQSRFADLLEEIRAAHPDDYAGAAALPDGHPFQAFIAFKADVPESVRSDPRLRVVKVDFRGHRGYSEREIEDRAREVHHALRDAGFQQLVTSYDLESSMIEVQLAPPSGHVNHADTKTMLPAQAQARDVRIELVDALPTEYEAVHDLIHHLALHGGFRGHRRRGRRHGDGRPLRQLAIISEPRGQLGFVHVQERARRRLGRLSVAYPVGGHALALFLLEQHGMAQGGLGRRNPVRWADPVPLRPVDGVQVR
jgi:hypothetical protein